MFKTIEIALAVNLQKWGPNLAVASGQLQKFGKDVKDVSGASNEHLEKVGHSALAIGAGFVAGFALVERSVMGFDKQMSEVAAATDEGADGMDRLRTAALDAGQATVFSASQAATAERELAKAGISTRDILSGGLTGALDLAAAGNLELGRAAEISAAAMSTFSLKGSDVPHIADVLAASAGKSAGEVEDMAQAMSQGGLVASQLGLSLEDTTGTLAAFAQNGLKGSDAGTSLKTMLQRLTPQSAEAAKAMSDLGLDFFDAQGNFVGVEQAAQQLQDRLSGLTQEQRASALQTIFGSDAVRAATILYQEGGKGIGEWVGKVDDSGYASELAAKKMDNLAGDVEKFSGSLETAFIKSGEGATGPLRSLTQAATDVVVGVTALPAPLQAGAVGFTGLAGGALLAVGAAGTFIPKYREVKAALDGMGTLGQKAGKGMGAIGIGISAAIPGILLATHLMGELEAHADQTFSTFTRGWKVPTSYTEQASQFNTMNAEFERLKKNADDLDTGPKIFAGALVGNLNVKELAQNLNPFDENTIANAKADARKFQEEIGKMDAPTRNWYQANAQLTKSLHLTSAEVDQLAQAAGVDLTGDVATSIDAVAAYKASVDAGTVGTSKLGQAIAGVSDVTATATDKTAAFTSQFNDLLGAQSSFRSASAGVEDARRAEADAQVAVTDANQAYQDSLQAVTDAEQRRVDSLAKVEDAQRSVEKAQRDMDDALSGESAAVSVDSAQLSLERAQAKLAKGGFTDPLDQRQAELDVRRARIDLDNAQEAASTSVADAEHNLRSAQDQLTAAQRDSEEASRGVTSAHRDVERASRDVERANYDAEKSHYAVRDAELNAAQAALELNGQQSTFNGLLASSSQLIGPFIDQIDQLKEKYPELAGALQQYLDAYTGRNNPGADQTGQSLAEKVGRGIGTFANGGIVAFADGDHYAQIGNGTTRMWNEPETGGEAYIPLTASKRQRSTRILGSVASRFGYSLTAGDGGGSSVPGAGGGFTHNGDINIGTANERTAVDIAYEQRKLAMLGTR